MAYLLFSSSFLENYDSIINECFEYAYEREDECLFEEVLLNELSQDKKIRAATRAKYYADPMSFAANAKWNAEEYLKQGNGSEAQFWASQHGKALAGKRNRLFKFLQNTPSGTKYKDKDFDGKEEERTVTDYNKEGLERIQRMMSDENEHKEYNELRKKIEELNKDNPEIKKNHYRLFKTSVKPSSSTTSINKKEQEPPSENMKRVEASPNKSTQTQTNLNNNNPETTTNTKESPNKSTQTQINLNNNPETTTNGTKKSKILSRIRAIIDSLKKKYNTLKSNIQNTPPEKRSLLQKFMNKIIEMIDKFKGLLSK